MVMEIFQFCTQTHPLRFVYNVFVWFLYFAQYAPNCNNVVIEKSKKKNGK